MPGVKIENQVIVAAGSVVTKSVKSRTVVGGVPAKVLSNYDEMEKRILEEYPSHSDLNKNLPYETQVKQITKFSFKPYL